MNNQELRDKIYQSLESFLDFNLNEILISVEDSHVDVSGFVETNDQKRQVSNELKNFEEIKKITNGLEVRHPFSEFFPMIDPKEKNGLIQNHTGLI